MTREYVTAESFLATINGQEKDRDHAAECAEHGNAWASSALDAVADPQQLDEGSPFRRQIAAAVRLKALAYHYTLQAWPDRARECAPQAQEALDAVVERIKVTRPRSTRTTVVSRNLAGGYAVLEPSGYATLAVG